MKNKIFRHTRLIIIILTGCLGLALTTLWGQAAGSTSIFTWRWPVPEMGRAQIILSGRHPGDGFGERVASGDFNGDGLSDLIVGAPYLSDGSSTQSEVYLIPGPFSIGQFITVPQRTAITFRSEIHESQLGRYIDSGDFNGDGYDDVVLGDSPTDMTYGPAGITYIYPGDPEISPENPRTIFPAGNDMALTIRYASGGIGVCNINGDNYDDLFIGNVRFEEGFRLHVWGILGNPSINLTNTTTIDLQNDDVAIQIFGQDLSIWGEPTSGNIGCGDIDGDGTDDLVIGAFGENPEGKEAAGNVYIIRGSPSITVTHPITLQMPQGAGAVIRGVDTFDPGDGDSLGQSLAAGDTNGDGRDDLVLGAPGGFGPNNGISHTGEVYLWLGRQLQGQTFDIDTQAEWILHGVVPFSLLGGRALHIDDLDKDGEGEVLIGCIDCDESPAYPIIAGRGFVIESGLSSGWHPVGESASFYAHYDNSIFYFGGSATSADLDANGFPDAVFGAPSYGFGGDPNVPGKVYIIPYPNRYKLYFPLTSQP